mmetsp:Transcript_94838/g.178441  ORF Transcript_94838/g.178441 Transcript_94838/m.178441 type:complete len:434 (-) Transcript_94838:40-1341(-)
MQLMKELQLKMGLFVVPRVRDCVSEEFVNRLTADLGLLAVGRSLPDLGIALQSTFAEGRRSGTIQHGTNSVAFWVMNLQTALAVVIVIVVVVGVAANEVMQEKDPAEESVECRMIQDRVFEVTSDSKADAERAEKLNQDLADMQKELELARAAAEVTDKLKQELAEKQHELDMAQTKIEAMASKIDLLEADARQTEKLNHDLHELRQKLCFAREGAELTGKLKQDLVEKQHDLELANSKIDAMTSKLDMLEEELQETKDLVVEQGQELDSVKVEKEMLALELETSEAQLEEERDQASRIVNKLKKLGCPLDAEGHMRSKYAKEALKGLKGVQGKCCITVNYENSLSNPVGAIVYAHDEQEACTKIVSAFAAPKRGLTAANLEAVTSYAKRHGDNRLVLDSVAHGVQFWQHMGFTEDPDLSDDLAAMSKPLDHV